MSLLPSKPDTSAAEEAEPRVIGVDSDDADDVLSALTSETARELLSELHREPSPPAEVADRVDTSLQNAQYHLEKLENAGAIEVIDTIYSEKGREMNVYAPADQPLVIFAGDEDQTTGLKAALSRLLGSLGILGLASLAVQELVGGGVVESLGAGDGPGGQESGGAAGPAPAAGNETTTTGTPDGQSTQLSGRTQATATEDGGGGGFNIAEADTTTTGDAASTPARTATEAAGTPAPDAAGTATRAATETAAPTAAPSATDAATTAEPAATTTAADTVGNVTTAASGGDPVGAALGMEPGLLFFLGGATALLIGAAVLYATR